MTSQQTPNVFTYPRNEPGTTGHLDIVEALRTMPRQLADSLKGLMEAEALYRVADGEWCIKEHVGHVRDYVEVQHKRLYMMSTQTDPILEPYDGDAYARDHAYIERDLSEMLRELASIREDTVGLLTSLVNWNWARAGQHTEIGRLSIRQLAERMIVHEGMHLVDVRALRAAAVAAGV